MRDLEKKKAADVRYRRSEKGKAACVARNQLYRKTDKGKAAETRFVRKSRQRVIAALGGKCARCGFDDWRALQIDHVNGGGTREHEQMGSRGVGRKILRGETEGYQLLCANCNWIKRYVENETRQSLKIQGG